MAKNSKIMLLGLLCVLSVGVWLRARGLNHHVTYVDEILLLTKGQLITTEQDMTPEPLWGYLEKIVFSKTTSYAPFSIFTAKLIIGPEMFSLKALKVLRCISLTFSVLALFLFAHLSYVFSYKRLSLPMLLMIGCFSCQMLQWVNAKQAHSYSAGVFAVLMGLELLVWLISRTPRKSALVFPASAALLGMFQYQFLLFSVALAISVIYFCKACSGKIENKKWILISAVSLLIYSLVVIACLSKIKGGLMAPYWLSGDSTSGGFSFHGLYNLIHNLFNVLVCAHLIYFKGESVLIGLCASAVFSLGIWELFKRNKELVPAERVSYLSLILFLFIWIAAFLVGKTPISPTRHSLIFLAPILLIELKGLLFVSDHLKKIKCNWFLGLLLISLLAVSIRKFPQYFEASKETFDVVTLKNLTQQYGVKELIAWDYDYSKLRLFGKGNFKSDEMLWRWSEQLDGLDKIPIFLLELGSSSGSAELLSSVFSKEFVIRKVFEQQKEYDFEPAKQYTYGGNVFRIWFLDPVIRKRKKV